MTEPHSKPDTGQVRRLADALEDQPIKPGHHDAWPPFIEVRISPEQRDLIVNALRAPAQGQREPDGWQYRIFWSDGWGPWLNIEWPIEQVRTKHLLKSGTMELRPLYAAPLPPQDGTTEALRLLRRISDLVDAEDVGEPLDDAISYANKAIAALTSGASSPQESAVPPALVTGLEVAEVVHNARWPEDRATFITPFLDEDQNGREYCFRIARAIIKHWQLTPVHSQEAKDE